MRSFAGAGRYLGADLVELQRTLEDDFDVFTAASGEEAQRIMETKWV